MQHSLIISLTPYEDDQDHHSQVFLQLPMGDERLRCCLEIARTTEPTDAAVDLFDAGVFTTDEPRCRTYQVTRPRHGLWFTSTPIDPFVCELTGGATPDETSDIHVRPVIEIVPGGALAVGVRWIRPGGSFQTLIYHRAPHELALERCRLAPAGALPDRFTDVARLNGDAAARALEADVVDAHAITPEALKLLLGHASYAVREKTLRAMGHQEGSAAGVARAG